MSWQIFFDVILRYFTAGRLDCISSLNCICRGFQRVDEVLLAPVIEALGPVANISVESQVNLLFSLGVISIIDYSFGY